MTDPYVYPGTDVLRNKLDIREKDDLDLAERRLSVSRMADVVRGSMTYAGYRQIHRHLFQDVYDWAGEPRTVNIHKGRATFAFAGHIDASMEKLFRGLGTENDLRGLARDRFVNRAAWYVGEINAVHPFREGNGRTNRAFLKRLAAQAGWRMDLTRVEPKRWLEASIASFEGRQEPLEKLIDSAITGRTRVIAKQRSRGRDGGRGL